MIPRKTSDIIPAPRTNAKIKKDVIGNLFMNLPGVMKGFRDLMVYLPVSILIIASFCRNFLGSFINL
jgi:hypothetical protein